MAVDHLDRFDTLDNIRWSARTSPTDGPKRLCKFCILGVFLPVTFLCIPLYMRFLAFQPHFFHISPLDMKLLNQESTVSTIWCQSQELRVNGTFNAYLLPRKPKLQRFRKSVNMTRKMNLPDDVKEYWGFYLIKGSHVRLDVCSRYEGASFIVVKSLKDARRCAFLGELDSDEESDENSDSDEFEFIKDSNRPEVTSPPIIVPENETAVLSTSPSPESREKMKNFMSSYMSMNIQQKQVLLKNMLTAIGQDPASEEQINDARLNSIVNKLLMSQRTEENGKTFRFGNFTTNDNERAKIRSNETRHGEGQIPHDESEDGAFENFDDEEIIDEKNEGVTGLTDRGTFQQKTKNDKSREETKSSWSSSEEALARCEGLIYNIALNGDPHCAPNASMHDVKKSMTQVSYDVTETGFYYFIFANENEIVDNFLVANFNLQKTLFDVSEQIMNCTNTTGSCIFPLTFWSEDYVVLEAPEFQPDPQGPGGENMTEQCSQGSGGSGVNGFTNVPECHYVMSIVSICQPRKHIYVIFILLVPVIILFGANL